MEQKSNQIRYEDYRGIVLKRASVFARQYNLLSMLEDIVAEGEVIFCQALQSFDPCRGSFSTYLWNKLKRLQTVILKKFLREEIRTTPREIFTEDHETMEFVEQLPDSRWDPQVFQSYYEEAREQLSAEHFAMFKFCLTVTEEQLHSSKQPRCRYMVEEYSRFSGVSKFRVRILWRDLREWWGKRLLKGKL